MTKNFVNTTFINELSTTISLTPTHEDALFQEVEGNTFPNNLLVSMTEALSPIENQNDFLNDLDEDFEDSLLSSKFSSSKFSKSSFHIDLIQCFDQ